MKKIIQKFIPFLDVERKRSIWIRKQIMAIPNYQSILDAGAGECKYKNYCDHLKYLSQDFGKYDGSGDNIGLQTKSWDYSRLQVISDIISIPFSDNSFDNILCTEVLEHIPFPELAIKEFSRILKKDGRLILTAPFCSQTHFAPFHFCTGFNIYWYKESMKKYDLEIIEIDINGNYFDYIRLELARLPLMIKRYTLLSYIGYLFYIVIIPIVLCLSIICMISKDSERQLCYGYHILAKKKVVNYENKIK